MIRRRCAALLALVLLTTGCIPPQAGPSPSPTETSTTPVSPTPTPLASSTLTTLDMSAALLAKSLPYANGFELTRTVRGRSGQPANGFEPVRTTPPAEGVGSTNDFWTYDFAAKKNVRTTATLRLITDHVKWWVANNVTVNMSALGTTANNFETKTYPTDRQLYGEEWSPGIDADPRINFVFARLPGSAAGYFSGADEEPVWVNEFSAERELMYLNTLGYRVGSPDLDSVIAHEFCHMIQFNTRRRSAVWFNEGHGVLCQRANGFLPTDGEAYLRVPDTQLNDWADLDTARPHYGLAYMFLDYLRQNAGGDDLIRAFMQKGIDTPADFDAVLKQRGQPGIEEQWANFVAANAFIGQKADRPYTYPQGAPSREPAAVVVGDAVNPGGTFRSTVHEYSVKYVELPRGKITLRFGGQTQNRLISTDPHSGRTFWWSDRGDGMDSSLTKSIDLRSATDPKLAFWAWFAIEADYDYAYVTVSSDGGAHWTPLKTEASTSTDPNGQNLGNGITGSSGGQTATGWAHLTADLSPYAGKQVQLRFEYVTDGNLNFGGFAVDDIEIPGLPLDEAETDNGWTTSGFIRSTNIVSQRFLLQVLHFGDRGTVERRAVDNGDVTLDLDTTGDRRALLAVTGFAVRSTEPVAFTVSAETRP
jgi:immune inhibitor A